jgi:hypothetical protein
MYRGLKGADTYRYISVKSFVLSFAVLYMQQPVRRSTANKCAVCVVHPTDNRQRMIQTGNVTGCLLVEIRQRLSPLFSESVG